MKTLTIIIGLVLLTSCSSTRFVDSWKNKEVEIFQPQKILIVGMTDNLTARKIFEQELKKEFIVRGMNAFESSNVLGQDFTNSQRSEDEINEMIDKLTDQGFDAAIITAVKGIDDTESYRPGYYTIGYHWKRFGRYYYRFQDVYYSPAYYENYKVFHVETSVYNISSVESKSLVWVGSFNIVNPQKISSTVNDYIEKIIEQLEKERLIKSL